MIALLGWRYSISSNCYQTFTAPQPQSSTCHSTCESSRVASERLIHVSEHRQGLDATIALWMGASSPVLPCAPPLASGWACAGFTVVCAVDTGPPHDGHSRVPMWAARSRRTHQRNGLAHVPGRDVPDVLREHGNFS